MMELTSVRGQKFGSPNSDTYEGFKQLQRPDFASKILPVAMSDSVTAKVSVFVRCRPLSSKERMGRRCLSITRDSVNVGDKAFNFETIFGEESTQQQLYESCVKDLIAGCFQGYNGTVFAYGQTGSGKTHSIMGNAGVEDEEGIIPRAVKAIFHTLYVDKSATLASANIRVSMLEIYNDDVKDLLHPDIPTRDIMIREDKDGRIFFTGAREEAVQDVRTAMFYLEQGNLNRSTAETLMNQTSSRSHAIFTISIETLELSAVSNETPREGQAGSYVQAKLHLVDLAGSERAKRTGAVGARLKESVGINQGLLSLGKVIRALTSNPIQHVPYRESKLTRFLQDSLGGNSRTVMLACISSAECNLHETLSTLQYAHRARAVQNKLSANVSVGLVPVPGSGSEFQTEMESSVIVSLRSQIAQMQTELSHHHSYPSHPGIAGAPGGFGEREGLSAQEDTLVRELREELEGTQRTLTRTVRVLGKIQHTLREHIRHLETTGGNTPEHCGPAWNLVNVCETVVSTLEELQHQGQIGSSSVLPSRALRSSLNESISGLLGGANLVPNLTEEVAALRAELEECREDLKRDEDIFAEKVKELKRCRKRIRELEVENKQLSEKHQLVQSQVQRLATTLLSQQRRAQRREARAHKHSQHGPHGDGSNLDDSADGEGEVDDLDISVAVAITEPDISQLMEDLETMAREKDDLLADNLLARDNVSSAKHLAQAQRDEFQQGQLALKEQLGHLEESIHHKERLIRDLTEAQSEIQREAVLQQERARTVEAESRRLREQLRELDDAKQATAEEVSEEREKRRDYEARLRVAEEQLQHMERERKEFMAAERQKIHSEEKSQFQEVENRQAAEHLLELETFKAEYARLTAQIDQAENKQRKTLESLTHQIDQYKKKSADSQRQIKILEEKNVDLRNRLERLTNAKRKTGHDETSDIAEAKSDHHNTSQGGGERGGQMSKQEVDEAQMSAQAVGEWIRAKVEDIVEFRNAKNELERLHQKHTSLNAERAGVESELKPILQKAGETEGKLKKKVTEIDTKINSLKDKMTALQRRIAAARARNIESPDLLQELEDLQESIDSYQEHQREYTDRIHRGGLDDVLLNQKQDLLEELETIHTEIELNQARMAHENLRLGKLEDAISTGNNKLTPRAPATTAPASADRALPSDEDCFNLLMRELKQTVIKTDNPRIDAKLEAMLKELVGTIVAQKTQTSDNSASIKQLQQQLDDKTAENEELVRTMQKSRTEAIRRQDQQKRESEDKIAFLLHQLRSAEARRVQDDNGSVASTTSKSNTGNLSARGERGDRTDRSERSERGLGATAPQEGFALTIANRNSAQNHNFSSTGGASSRPSSAAGAPPSPGWGHVTTTRTSVSAGGARPPSDTMLSELARLDPRDINKEIERRWTAEKERREQLEKRNAEMVRELRQLRSESAKWSQSER